MSASDEHIYLVPLVNACKKSSNEAVFFHLGAKPETNFISIQFESACFWSGKSLTETLSLNSCPVHMTMESNTYLMKDFYAKYVYLVESIFSC